LPIDNNRKGQLIGRVMSEATTGGKEVRAVRGQVASTASENNLKTVVYYQQVGTTRYFSAAGFAGRTVGIDSAGRPDRLDDVVSRH